MEPFDTDAFHYITAGGLPAYLDSLAAESPLAVFTDMSDDNLNLQLGKCCNLPAPVCGLLADILYLLAETAEEL